MGAYSNPEIIVDTQTGQHFRNLQQSIAGSFTSFAESYALKQKEKEKKLEENKAELKKINAETENYAFALRSAVNKVKSTNDKVNLVDTFEPLIQKAVMLKSGLLNNTITGAARQSAMQELADINSTIDADFSTSLADLSGMAEDLQAAMLKGVGVAGGLDGQMPANTVRALNILQGKLGGSKKAVYNEANPKNLTWEIYDEQGKLVESFAASKLKQMNDLDINGIKIIPDPTANNEALKNQVSNVFEGKSVDPRDPSKGTQSTGRITNDFLKKANGQIVMDKVPVGDPTQGVYKMVAKVDKDLIKTQVNTQLNAQLGGMDDDSLSMFYNNVILPHKKAKKEPFYILDSDKALDPRERAEAEQAYKSWWLDTQVPNEQPILKEDGNVAVFEEPKLESGSAKKDKKEEKKSQQQVLLEKVFETPSSQRTKNNVGQGTIVKAPGGTRTFKILTPEDGGKTGWWSELDKDGLPIGKPLTDSYVKNQIGYRKQ
jgi:hypothetical protein